MNLPALNKEALSEKYESSQAVALIFPIFGIIASFLIAVLVIWPKVNDILDLKESNKQLTERVQNMEQKIVVLQSLDRNKLEDQLIASEQLLPSEMQRFPFLSQVEQSAASAGILLNKIDVIIGSVGRVSKSRNAVAEPKADSVAINLSASSDYQSMVQFLSRLYSFSRVVSVEGVNVSSSQADGSQLRSTFTVSGFWRSLPDTLGSVESAIQPLTQAEEKLLEEVSAPEAIQAPQLPQVPVGRGNLFTPF